MKFYPIKVDVSLLLLLFFLRFLPFIREFRVGFNSNDILDSERSEEHIGFYSDVFRLRFCPLIFFRIEEPIRRYLNALLSSFSFSPQFSSARGINCESVSDTSNFCIRDLINIYNELLGRVLFI